ncbi:MAG: T9SS type A sorting domain-containing protein [FCB group bacterium]|nr:T9SS type A sorting domain-containing protein [FCB group bacterium]MBL7028366.1 T9SS type A sorting domain-containing protein [Candidatus Neomarinimicrobiota bacterium]MBL7121289.1 T9SS type A sorting domain-containing protein [Candidatus Neomarinimicrobiota bacterium]
MYRVKTLLVMTTILVLSTSLFAIIEGNGNSDALPYYGNVQPLDTRDTDTRDTDATLTWLDGITPNTNFVGSTNDYFMEYYVAPADGYINSIDFNFSNLFEFSGGGMSIWIYEAAYPWPEIDSEGIADVSGDAWLGYYDETSGFETTGTNWVRGGVNDLDGALDVDYDPLGAQVWPAFGSGSISLEPNADDGGVVNFDLVEAMGTNHPFLAGDEFVVVVRFNGFEEQGDDGDYQAGFLSATLHVDPQPSLKFYGTISSPDGRLGNDDWGWYIRSYVWDWGVNVTLTSDRAPVLTGWNELGVTLSQDARTATCIITDDNPSGGDAGVASANLMYSVDGADYVSVAMTAEVDTFSADIPGIAGGDVDYYFEATDVLGNTNSTLVQSYSVFVPSAPTLVVFNGGATGGYPYAYYFGISDFTNYSTADFPHDVWDGPILEELAAAYTTIYEISHYGNGPAWDNREVIAAWLETGVKNYGMFGDEFFGAWTGWIDQDYVAGDFEYDVLGVAHIYNDIVASSADVTPVEAVDGNVLTGELYTAHTALGDTLMYDPVYEVGGVNWLDGFDVVDAGSENMVTLADGMAIGLNRMSGDDKIVVLGFDPISINASPYTWWGFSYESAQTQSLEWFEIWTLSVDDVTVPENSALSAAYPNPFNPTTNIEFQLANASDVSLTVYNMLGQEVATLISGFQTAGSYTVQWNGLDAVGHSVPSGLYFYTMQTEGFSATQKMMLLK